MIGWLGARGIGVKYNSAKQLGLSWGFAKLGKSQTRKGRNEKKNDQSDESKQSHLSKTILCTKIPDLGSWMHKQMLVLQHFLLTKYFLLTNCVTN